MDRRFFIKSSILASFFAFARPDSAFAGTKSGGKVRRGFPGPVSSEIGSAGPEDLSVKFLGTGASGWKGPDCGRRRHSSVLLDSKVFIDLTFSALDLIPSGVHPKSVLYTHSHSDHFDPETALKLGISTAYVSETWIERARKRFKEASELTGIASPEIVPLKIGEKITVEGLTFTPLPANHYTSDLEEQALIYMVEKGGVRMLYATDTGGIIGKAAKIGEFDPLSKSYRPFNAFIMEGTIPPEQEEDYRIFSHSTMEGVARIANTLLQTGRYTPPEGQPVYITHMSTKNFPPHDKLNRWLPWPLRAAYDGQEIVFRAK